MTHNWKPGDLAIYDDQRVMLTNPTDDRLVWVDAEEIVRRISSDNWDGVFRPLLVIDPEDRAQIERLADVFCQAPSSGWVDQMQAALRSLLESEPEEPTNLGAVVQSDDGSVWVRGHDSRTGWVRTAFVNETWAWSDLPRPLTVLSPGYVEEGE